MICSAIDITARKLAEQVIERANEDLERRVNERTGSSCAQTRSSRPRSRNVNVSRQRYRLANHKLNTLSGITRHDILNQITAVVMYLSLIREVGDRSGRHRVLEKIEEVTQMIQKQIQFTRDYQDIGVRRAALA